MRAVVVGAGISGLTSALMLREAGADVTVVTVGFGGLQLGQGTLDILDAPRPLDAMDSLPAAHPYHLISADSIRDGVAAFQKYVPLEGSVEESSVFPTALGSLRRTALYPASMASGKIRVNDDAAEYDDVVAVDNAPMVLVGFSGLKDFYPKLAAENLVRSGVRARAVEISLVAPGDTALAFSRSLAEPGAAAGLGRELAAVAKEGERIGIPAVVRGEQWKEIQDAAGHPVFQIPMPPPSIPGLEMNDILRDACAARRVRMMLNGRAVGLDEVDGRITGVRVAVAGATKSVAADYVIYAGGGLDSGAIELDSYRRLIDQAFGLPIDTPEEILHGDYLGAPQPLFATGVVVDREMRPLDGTSPVYPNLFAVGGMLAGAYRPKEKSGEGIALGSAAQAVATIMRSEA